jgi:carbon-monoxide dehydrogenase iron sulfur subunit
VEEDDFRRLMAESPAFSAFLKEVGRSRMLGHTAIFKGLDPEDLAAVQNLFEERNLAENEVIFEEGEVSAGLYVILRGTVSIAKRARSGQDLTLAYLGPGDLLGEQGLIDSQRRSATAVATEPTKLLALPREDFLRLLRERPVVSFNMLRILSQRLRETSREAATAKGTSFFRGITIIARPERCLSCRACEMACAVSKSRTRDLFEAIQEEPLPVRRIHVRRTNKGAEPIVRPEHCVHCREAPCLVNCKLHAIRRDAFSGTIVIDEKACKGCGLCARACPFRVIAMIPGQGKRRMALKCTHCAEDQAGPACVRSCPTHALVISLSSMTTV